MLAIASTFYDLNCNCKDIRIEDIKFLNKYFNSDVISFIDKFDKNGIVNKQFFENRIYLNDFRRTVRSIAEKLKVPHIVAAQVINNCNPYSFKGFLKDMCFTGDLYCIFDQSEQKYRINDKDVYIVLSKLSDKNKLDFLQKKADYYIKAFDYFEQIKSYFRDSIKQAIETDKQYQYGSHNLQKYSLIIANFNESHKSFYPILKELLDLHLASLE